MTFVVKATRIPILKTAKNGQWTKWESITVFIVLMPKIGILRESIVLDTERRYAHKVGSSALRAHARYTDSALLGRTGEYGKKNALSLGGVTKPTICANVALSAGSNGASGAISESVSARSCTARVAIDVVAGRDVRN